uniref:hypothetical protein n=1 Tax=uncultured Agrococcus sp. TaxID=382258 RepID=UPI0025DD3FEC
AELIAAEGDDELDLVVELSGTARRSLLGRAKSAVLMLGGYRSGRNTAVSSESLQHSNGRVSAHFVLPEGALREFRGDRAALWTAVTLQDGRGSGRARLRAKEAFSARRKGVRVFSTKRGGVGIDLRE